MASSAVKLNLARQVKTMPNLGLVLVVCHCFSPKCLLGQWTENNKNMVSVHRQLDRRSETYLVPKDKSIKTTLHVGMVAERLCKECQATYKQRVLQRVK